MRKLPIIYYHEIVPEGEGYSYQKIESPRFEEQMRYLAEHGYHSILLTELEGPLPEKPIVVSFDDGFSSVFSNAAPLMERYGIHGNIYLATGRISKDENFLTWREIDALKNSGYWAFAAHTHSHPDIRTLTATKIEKEVELSRDAFQNHLGYIPDVFCIPYGKYTKGSAAQFRKIGNYDYVLGSYYGFADLKKAGNTVLPRIGISNDDAIVDFEAKLSGKRNWKGPLQRLRLTMENIRTGGRA